MAGAAVNTVPPRQPSTAGGTALLLALIAISGNPVFSGTSTAPGVIVLLIAAVLIARGGSLSVRFLRRYTFIAGAFGIVFVAHQVQLGSVSVFGSAYFLIKVFVGGLVVSHLGFHFGPRLFDATYLLCVSSLFCYAALLLIGPEAFPTLFPESLIGDNLKSIAIFTVLNTPEWWRNSSMLWEPGAFQGIVNLALLLTPAHVLTHPRYRLKVALMVVAILTTFSTTGYLVLFLLAAYKMGRFRISAALRLPLVLAVGLAAAIAISQAEFLGEKIAQQIASSAELEDFAPDRFGALVFDLQYIQKHPAFGNGLTEETRFADHPHLHGVALGHGNGLSNFTATFGLFGLLTYFGAIALSRIGGSLFHRLVAAFTIAVLSFGEQFLMYPLFLGLPFVFGSDFVPRRLRRAARRALATRRRAQAGRTIPEPLVG